MKSISLLVSPIVLLLPLAAAAGVPPPANLNQRTGFDQRLGAQIPMTVPFRDEQGRRVSLSALTRGTPTLLAMGYYRCKNLCNVVLHGIAQAASAMPGLPGRDYQVVFVSIDPRETPSDARHTAQMIGRMSPEANAERWHLLTGESASIQALANAIGFRYFHDLRNDQYAHAAGLVVLTGQGRVSRYLFGVSYSPQVLRLALRGASQGKTGNVIDHLVMFCAGYDPSTGRYNALVGRVMQGMSVGFVMVLLVVLFRLRHRARM